MKKILIVLLILALAALGVFAATRYLVNTENAPHTGDNGTQPDQSEKIAVPQGQPTFLWEYDAYETPEIHRTIISLTATYPDGTSRTKVVENIEGSCNELTDPDTNAYEHSTVIMCYYAGFGRYYKVMADDQGYTVERKEFEEASPDYNPPQEEYRSIMRF